MHVRSLVLVAFVSGTVLGAFAQERVKAKGPADFDTLHAATAEHWKAERFGKCFVSARELVGVVALRRAKVIRAAMPAAPAGYTIEPPDESNPEANAMLAALSAGVGTVIEQTYRGNGNDIRVTVTADSPMLQMFKMILQNPAMLQPNQELVKYSECSAVLETQGQDVTLRFMLQDSLVEGYFNGVDGDFALKMFDQKAVSALNAAIVN